jgi:hypothetical protein
MVIVFSKPRQLLWGEDSKYRIHLKGLRNMVRLRCRPESLTISHDLKGSIVWYGFHFQPVLFD